MQQDTDPQVTARYLELSAALAPMQRLQIAADLSQAVRELALAGVRHRHPSARGDELRWRFAETLYGTEFALQIWGPLPHPAA